jgi:hypothetical protein
MTIDPNNIDYTHAKEVYNSLMNKTDLLIKKQTKLMFELKQTELYSNIGLGNYVINKEEIDKQLNIIKNQLVDILKDIRFIRRMTELNLPINFN